MGVTFVAPEQADDVHRIASGLSLENEFAKGVCRRGCAVPPSRPWRLGPPEPPAAHPQLSAVHGLLVWGSLG